MGKVRRPHEKIKRSVANQSARAPGSKIRLIVLHDTESHDRRGLSDLGAICGWFDNPSAQASAHVVVDAEGQSARCVPDARKAWHCAAYNSVSLGIEQIGFATFTRSKWSRRKKQRDKVARYIAYWHKQYGEPIRRAKVRGGYVRRSGVATHKQLGAAGGGHGDPGRGYPFRRTLRLARRYAKKGW